MFNRANKITSLLLAAAAVASFVPATGVSAATRLSTKEGTISNAVAFNGKYIYEGYKSDDVDKAVWYNNGEKDSQVTDYDDEDYDFTSTTYGEKYVLAQDGNDDYLVDLSSGKVLDETRDDKLDNTASALEKAIKKTDKFDGQQVDKSELENNVLKSSAKFQEPWYYVDKTDSDGNSVRIFTSADGKYVTSDQIANIYAYSTKQKKVVKINKFDKENSDAKLTATIAKAPEVIAQDKDYLYAVVKVSIKDTNGISADDLTKKKEEATKALEEAKKAAAKYDKVAVDEKAAYDNAVKDKAAKDKAVEDAAKAVAEATKKLEDAKTALVEAPSDADKQAAVTAAKTALDTATQAETDAKAAAETAAKEVEKTEKAYNEAMGGFADEKKKADDAVAAAKAKVDDLNKGDAGTEETYTAWYLQKISKAQGDKDDEAYMPKSVDSYLIDNKTLYDNGDCNDAYDWLIDNDSVANFINVSVDGSSLYAYKDMKDKVKVLKLDLKKMKENPINKSYGDSKLDGYAVKKDGDTDHDYTDFDVDSKGIVWLLDDGKIVKFEKKDKTDVYSCDSGLDKLSVYDENNLIAWNEDDERYTTVTEGKKQTLDDATAIDPNANKPAEVKTGWQQDTATGAWTLLGTDGVALTGWQNVGGAWYYMDPTTTIMAKGWKQVNGTWYFLNDNGTMATGWIQNGGNWYYLEPVNSNGSMKTGWFQDTTGTWYYADGSGKMLSNTVVDGYVLGESGAWVK